MKEKEKGISRNIGAGNRRAVGEGSGLDHFRKKPEGTLPAREEPPSPPPVPAPLPAPEPLPEASPKGERRRRRVVDDGRYHQELDEKRIKSAMMLWTLLLGLLGVTVLVLFVLFWLRPYIQQRDRMAAISPRVNHYIPIEEAIDGSKLGETETLALARRVMAARTEEEVREMVDPGTESVPEVVAFLTNLTTKEGAVTGYQWTTQLDTLRPDVSAVVVSFIKDGQKSNRLALFSPDEAGHWKMDFPAFVRLASPSWGEFLSGASETSVVRVYVQKDQYFNGPFQEGGGWICYGMASPDVDHLFFGYCRGDSDQAKALRSLLNLKKMARATLALEKHEGADKRQFVIKRVLAYDWIVGDEPADQPFR